MIANPRQEILFWLGVTAVFFLLVYLLSPILLPFAAGGIIAYFLDPAVRWLSRWRVPRWLSSFVVLVIFGVVLGLLIALIVPLVRLQASELVARLPAIVAQAQALLNQLMAHAAQSLPPEDFAKLQHTLGGSMGDVLAWAVRQVQSVLSSGLALANLLSLVVITPVVAFFLLRDWDRIVAAVDSWLPRDHLRTLREQAREVDAMLGGYIRGQLLVCVALALFYAVALSLSGLEFGLIVGILTGILAFIPYVGFAIGFVLALGLGLLQFGWGWGLIWVLLTFAVGQVLESSFLSPKLVGERVRLHPVWVIFALLAFGSLFGFLGVLIALPAAAVTGVVVRFALSRYKDSMLYRGPDEVVHPHRRKSDAAE
ncbi:MAG TPA: AI-2E family transporter [Stellaceae bacterium]|jgi:predicted PurR-regulated permease PerM